MINRVLKQILRDLKEYIRYLSYKSTLPKNRMHDDIYLVEFPKSGITWLQHIIGNVELKLQNRNEEITFYNFHKYMIDIHQVSNSYINRQFDRTFIKSHSEYNSYYSFVIYLIRNPFDVMISYYNFMMDHGYERDFIDFVKDPEYGIFAWKRHINSWIYKKVKFQRLHLIKYENLLYQPYKEIKDLYKNLGLNISDYVIEYTLAKSNIHYMKDSEEHYRKYNPNYTLNFVGKKGKKRKEELMTEEIRDFIQKVAFDEIKYFYPDLIR